MNRGVTITDTDHSAAAVAGRLFSEVPSDPAERRSGPDESPAAMRVLRAPFAVEPAKASDTDSQPHRQDRR